MAWYVIQTALAKEAAVRRECEKQISETILERCILPVYEEKIKYDGKWHTRTKKLFPGYLFLVSDDVNELCKELGKIEGTTKLLGTGGEIVPLSEKEVRLLRHLIGEQETMEMSEGIIENDRVVILSGPLMGMESTIQKIDRHKRKAWISMEMFGGIQSVEVGLEIIRKA